jgi:CMP-N-acetylneuraminic acid synthetase
VSRAVVSALQSGAFEGVFVSTDDEEIASEAEAHGAQVLWRPEHLGLDATSTEDVIVHHLETELRDTVDHLCVIQCTSPFIAPAHLISAMHLLENTAVTSVFSATPDHSFRWEETPEGTWVPQGHSKSFRPRRQDLSPVVVESGAFYMFDVVSFLGERTRFCGDSAAFSVGRIESLEIDDVEDLEMANALAPLFDR